MIKLCCHSQTTHAKDICCLWQAASGKGHERQLPYHIVVFGHFFPHCLTSTLTFKRNNIKSLLANSWGDKLIYIFVWNVRGSFTSQYCSCQYCDIHNTHTHCFLTFSLTRIYRIAQDWNFHPIYVRVFQCFLTIPTKNVSDMYEIRYFRIRFICIMTGGKWQASQGLDPPLRTT